MTQKKPVNLAGTEERQDQIVDKSKYRNEFFILAATRFCRLYVIVEEINRRSLFLDSFDMLFGHNTTLGG